MLAKLKEAVGLGPVLPVEPQDPAAEVAKLEAQLADLDRQHAQLYKRQQNLLHGERSAQSLKPQFEAVNAQREEVRNRLSTLKSHARASATRGVLASAVERGREDLPAKEAKRTASVLAEACKARELAEAACREASEAQKAAEKLHAAAKAEAAKHLATYEASPSDEQWAAHEAASSRAKRAEVDLRVCRTRTAQAADVAAKAGRAADVAEVEHLAASRPPVLDDALVREAVELVERARVWFATATERQGLARAAEISLRTRALELGLQVPPEDGEAVLSYRELAVLAVKLWAVAHAVRGEEAPIPIAWQGEHGSTTVTTYKAPRPSRPFVPSADVVESLSFDASLVERAARALAR